MPSQASRIPDTPWCRGILTILFIKRLLISTWDPTTNMRQTKPPKPPWPDGAESTRWKPTLPLLPSPPWPTNPAMPSLPQRWQPRRTQLMRQLSAHPQRKLGRPSWSQAAREQRLENTNYIAARVSNRYSKLRSQIRKNFAFRNQFETLLQPKFDLMCKGEILWPKKLEGYSAR